MQDGKRKKLQMALELERAKLPEHDFFGEKTNFDDYAHTIWYLGGGGYDGVNMEENPLLESVVTDFDSIYSDYFE